MIVDDNRHMLIDAKNSLYRSIYAGLSDARFMEKRTDFSVIFFRTISSLIHKFKPKHVHFFWDAPKETLWRKQIYQDYKEGREQVRHHEHNVSEILARCSESIKALIPSIGAYSYEYETEEADDLIYAFCKKFTQEQMLIISSDNDFNQIAYFFRHVGVYNPSQHSRYILDVVNPVEVKCFMGEKGDNIPGYEGIGPVKAKQLATNNKARYTFFKERGTEIYERNLKLIDLSLNPEVGRNCMVVDILSNKKAQFDMNKLLAIVQERKINGLLSEASNLFTAFKFNIT